VTLACELKFNEFIKDEPISIENVANHYNFHPEATYRILRILDDYQIITLRDDHTVSAGPLIKYLDRFYAPHILNGYQIVNNLSDSLKTNEECYSAIFGKRFYDHIKEDSAQINIMSEWNKKSAEEWLLPSIHLMYDFSLFKKIAELNGQGQLLMSILAKNTHQRGAYLHNSKYVENFNAMVKLYPNLNKKICLYIEENEKNNFPFDCNLYIYCRALLNYNDIQLINKLNYTYSLMPKNSKLLVIDFMIPDKNHADYSISLIADINVLTCLGGKIRDMGEWLEIINKTSFSVIKIIKSSDYPAAKPLLPLLILEIMRN